MRTRSCPSAANRAARSRRSARPACASARTAGDATCRAASPGASPRARGRYRAPRRRACAAVGLEVGAPEGLEHRRVGAVGRTPARPRAPARRSTRRCAARPHPGCPDRSPARTASPAVRRSPRWPRPRRRSAMHAERRQVPLVEHDRVAQRDRPRVVGRRIDQIEDGARAGAVAAIPLGERRTVEGGARRHDHSACGARTSSSHGQRLPAWFSWPPRRTPPCPRGWPAGATSGRRHRPTAACRAPSVSAPVL